jgi:hypothetical protein
MERTENTGAAVRSPEGRRLFSRTVVNVCAASYVYFDLLRILSAMPLLSQSLERRSRKLFSSGLLCFAFMYQVPVLILRQRYEAAGGWAAMPAATIYVWSSISAVAGLLLFALFIIVVRVELKAGKMTNEASAVAS